jgi:tRNA dimethylallyltransferase
MTKKIIVICGATAVGKTAVAIRVAKHLNTSILSFDSRQCYQELGIGVAKPTPEELQQVSHYFIDSHSIHDEVNAGVYERYALGILEQLFQQHDTVIVVGGTGLYCNALCHGVDNIPKVPNELRAQLLQQYEENGLLWLQEEVQKNDAAYYKNNDIHNVQRMLRALEVVLHSGQSITIFQKGEKVQRNFEIIKYGIDLERPFLYERINKRVLQMMEAGLLAEAEKLIPFKANNALQTVGYSELFDYFDGKTNLDKAIELIQQHTRNYAKRQLTWFRKDDTITWYSPQQAVAKILSL